MKTLVNHDGIVQYKYIVRTHEELSDYILFVRSKQLAERIGDFIENPESDKQLEQLIQILKVAPINIGNVLSMELYKSCSKYIDKEVLVFNQAGGYTFFDESRMKILDWKYLHELNDTIILENSNEIDSKVLTYLKDNKISDYLKLNNLNDYLDHEVLYYCKNAKTIIFRTMGINIEKYYQIAEMLSPKKIISINSLNFDSKHPSLKNHEVILF
jgi:hypothetical protein